MRHEERIAGLERLAREIVTPLGVELVELSLRGSSRRRLLRVDIDRAGPDGVGLEDCKRVSDALGQALEESELLPDSYTLEVSSPGIDRPIRDADDVRRNRGRRVRLELAEPLDGESAIRGVLLGLEGDRLLVERGPQDRVEVPWTGVRSARQDIDL